MKVRNVICKNVYIKKRTSEYIICDWKCCNCLSQNYDGKIIFNKEKKLITMCEQCHMQNIIDIGNI